MNHAVTDASEEANTDSAFEILSNPRRRYVIEFLAHTEDTTVRLQELSEQLAAWENDISRQAVTYKQRKRVYTSLYQTHLPKLDEENIVEYDPRSGIVRPTSEVDRLYAYVQTTPTTDDSWQRLELAVSGGCLLVASVVGMGLIPYGGESGYAVGVIVSVLFFAFSVRDYYFLKR